MKSKNLRWIVVGIICILILAQGAQAIGYGKIAFAGNYPTNQDIYVINSDGTGLTRLTDDPSMDRFPAYSWDGTKIAFTSARGTGGTDHICVMDADGSSENCYMTIEGDSPAWSPDNTKIAFDWYDGINRNIYIVNSDGTGTIIPFTTGTVASARDAAWSPDGSQIAYTLGSNITLKNTDGTNERWLAIGNYPAWSPDGSQIAFDYSGIIYIIDTDGSNLHSIAIIEGAGHPTWSPDGSQIAFGAYPGGEFGIFLVNSNGTGLTRLTSNSDVDDMPTWDPATPVAVFSGYPTSGPPGPLTVLFTDSSTNTITRWILEFKLTTDTLWTTLLDTTSWTNPVPVTFDNPGVYDIRLTVSGPDGSDTKTEAGYITVASSALTVTGITPNFGVVNTGSVVISDLAGTDFDDGATVKLTRAGESDIGATVVTVDSANQIHCLFDLTGVATGSWNVVVTNPDLQTGTLVNGFAVMPTDRDGAVDHGVAAYLGGNEEGNGQQWLQASESVIPPDTEITLLNGDTITTPDVPVWVIFVDEDKQASYGHPCKLDLYYDDDNFIEYDVSYPPTLVNGIPIELTYGAGKAPNAGGLTSTEPPYIQDPSCVPDPAHNYAVLISGGGTSSTNYARYYNDIKFLYNTLVKDYKYDKTHIKVVMSDGTNDAADQVTYDANNVAKTINSEQNLDTTAGDDVNYDAASKQNIQAALNYWGPLTSSDSLLIFTTGHGEKVSDSGGETNSNDVNLLLWGSGVKVTDSEFVSYLPANPKITLVMEQCYGGGVKDEYIVSSVSNRVLATAAKGNQASHGNDFSYFWITAVAGHDSASPTPNPANADTSNNQQVSANEAFTYANFRDPSGPYGANIENPVYSSYVSGGGDSQYLSACTNPYSITPATPGTWTYPGSKTVTWTYSGFSSPYPNVKVELWKGTGTSALLQKTIATKAITLKTSGSWSIPSTLPGGPGPGYWIKISTIAPFVPTVVGSSGSFTINGVTASGIGNPTITSNPTDALIEITDSAGQPVYIGGVLQTGFKTPHEFTGIAAGTYLVKVSKSCYWPMNPTLITVAGGGSSATFGPYRLIAMPTAGSVCINDAPFGSIAITSEPEEGYWVSIDGGAMSYNTPVLQDIGVGPHSVTLDMPGYLSQTQGVIVKAGELTTAHFVLVPLPGFCKSGGCKFDGFYQPIDMGVLNTATAGKTIPVKWHLSDPVDGNDVSDPQTFVGLKTTSAGCSASSSVSDAIDQYSGSSGLQYLGDGNWQYNWKIPKEYAGTCRNMYIEFASGDKSPEVTFQFKK